MSLKILLSTESDAFRRRHLRRKLKLLSPLLSAEQLHTFINSNSIAACRADYFMSQVPGILFPVSWVIESKASDEWRSFGPELGQNRWRVGKVVFHFVYTTEAHTG